MEKEKHEITVNIKTNLNEYQELVQKLAGQVEELTKTFGSINNFRFEFEPNQNSN